MTCEAGREFEADRLELDGIFLRFPVGIGGGPGPLEVAADFGTGRRPRDECSGGPREDARGGAFTTLSARSIATGKQGDDSKEPLAHSS